MKMSYDEFRRRYIYPLDDIQAKTINEATTTAQQTTNSNAISMTLQQYVSNPTGKGTGYVAKRAIIKQGLNQTFIKLLRESRKAFYAVPYVYSNGDILFYVKVPSETYKENHISYDVLFLIEYDQRKERKNREVKFFSNCPAFIFTYCYVYNKNGLLISKLKNKFPIEALTKPPEIRNPIESLGYEKSTYIAASYLLDGNCLTDEYINKYGKAMTDLLEAQTFRNIADPETLIAIYQHAMYKERKTHRKPLSQNELKKRDDASKSYEKQQKASQPKGNFITHRAPRAKITARKAQKAFLNNPKKKN